MNWRPGRLPNEEAAALVAGDGGHSKHTHSCTTAQELDLNWEDAQDWEDSFSTDRPGGVDCHNTSDVTADSRANQGEVALDHRRFALSHEPSQRPTVGKPVTQVTARPTIPVEPPTPKPDAVKVYCGERSVQMEVDMDLLGTGQLIQPSDLTLGGCGPVGQDGSNQVLVFETELHSCGSVLAVSHICLMWMVQASQCEQQCPESNLDPLLLHPVC
ncbi:hypothetical protein GJAV_G00231180 [Gymnothorax javanicus]|nr:hypothetical protein GJAV_G00231180 [Gymnothorax javanicus]